MNEVMTLWPFPGVAPGVAQPTSTEGPVICFRIQHMPAITFIQGIRSLVEGASGFLQAEPRRRKLEYQSLRVGVLGAVELLLRSVDLPLIASLS